MLSYKLQDETLLISLVAGLLTLLLAGLLLLFSYQLAFVLFFLTIVAGVFAYFCFQHPWLMLFPITIGSFLGALYYFFESSPLPVTLFQFFLVAGLLILVLHAFYYKKFEIRLTGLELPVLILLSLIFISLVYSPGRDAGFFNALRFVILLIFILYIMNVVQKHRHALYILAGLVVVGVVLSAYSVAEYMMNPQIAIENILGAGASLTRVSAGGLYHDPNRFAAILFIPAAATAAVTFSNLNWKYRIISSILFVVLLGGIVASFSRSGLISLVIIVLLTISLTKQWKFSFVLGTLAFATVLVIPEFRSALLTTVDRIYEVAFGTSADDSAGIRMMLAIAGMNMFFESYMLGVGFGGFPERFTDYFTLQQSVGVNMPHNVTYKVMAELGLAGLLLFLFLFYCVVKTGYAAFKQSVNEYQKILYISLLTALIGYVTFYQFYGGALTDSNLMLLVGLIFAGNCLFTEGVKS